MYNLCYSYRKCVLWLLELLVICCLTMNHFFQRCFPSKEPRNFRELLKERSSNAANQYGRKESRSTAFNGCVIEKQPLPNGKPTNTSSHVFTVENTQRRSLESSSPVEKFRKQLSLSLTSLVEWNEPKALNSSRVEKDCAVSEPNSTPKATLASVSCESVMSVESPVADDAAKTTQTPFKDNIVVSSQISEKDDLFISSESSVKDDPKSPQISDHDDDLSMSLHTILEDVSSEVIQTTCDSSNVLSSQTISKDNSLSSQTRYEQESLKTVENAPAMSANTPAKHDRLASSRTFGEQVQPPSGNSDMVSSQSPIRASQKPVNNNFALQSPNDDSDTATQMAIDENETNADLELTTSPIKDDVSMAHPISVEENKGSSSQMHVENELIVEESPILSTCEIPLKTTNEKLDLSPQLQVEKDDSSANNDQHIPQSDCKHTNEIVPPSSAHHEDLMRIGSNSKAKVFSQRAPSGLPKEDEASSTSPHIRIAIDDDDPPDDVDDEEIEITHL
ncbi:uncharacterized protein [Palaemon carinicauda]|uniref:uncharacterized protein n=1 Tax=Palaemon carinicauda TaxID=392227 RepID=UPI0035B5A714